MSLQHRDIAYVGRDETGQRSWVGACECGWEGEPHPIAASKGADAARADYKDHVESVLGAQAYYDADAHCRNCGSRHRQGVLIGTHVTSAPCQNCGTRMLNPDNEAWDESRELSRDWGRWFR